MNDDTSCTKMGDPYSSLPYLKKMDKLAGISILILSQWVKLMSNEWMLIEGDIS